MRANLKKIALGGMLLSAWVLCASETSVAAGLEQSARGNASKEVNEIPSATKPDAVKLHKTVVLAKNTSTKTGTAAPATTAKPQVVEEKKTIGRCWKRLMSMVREANHLHRGTKK